MKSSKCRKKHNQQKAWPDHVLLMHYKMMALHTQTSDLYIYIFMMNWHYLILFYIILIYSLIMFNMCYTMFIGSLRWRAAIAFIEKQWKTLALFSAGGEGVQQNSPAFAAVKGSNLQVAGSFCSRSSCIDPSRSFDHAACASARCRKSRSPLPSKMSEGMCCSVESWHKLTCAHSFTRRHKFIHSLWADASWKTKGQSNCVEDMELPKWDEWRHVWSCPGGTSSI